MEDKIVVDGVTCTLGPTQGTDVWAGNGASREYLGRIEKFPGDIWVIAYHPSRDNGQYPSIDDAVRQLIKLHRAQAA